MKHHFLQTSLKKSSLSLFFLLIIQILFFIELSASDAEQFSERQQIIIDKMKESLAGKVFSEEYGNQFVSLLRDENPVGTTILRVTVNSDLSYSSYIVVNSHTQGDCLEGVLYRENLANEIIKRIKPNSSMDLFISLADGFYLSDDTINFIKDHIALLGCENKIDNKINILIPDFSITLNTKQKINKINKKSNEMNFFNKKPIAKFIGAQTGGVYSLQEIDNIPRLKAIHLAKEYPQFLEINFTSYTCQTNDPEYIAYMYQTFGPPAPWESYENLLNYRYLLSFDGNVSTWERPEIIMHSGSVPLFQTRFEKFWTVLLEDEVNYIKINDDLSNLVDTVRYLNNNPEHAEEIARQAQSLAKDVLTPDFFDKYFSELFNEIGNLQNTGI